MTPEQSASMAAACDSFALAVTALADAFQESARQACDRFGPILRGHIVMETRRRHFRSQAIQKARRGNWRINRW